MRLVVSVPLLMMGFTVLLLGSLSGPDQAVPALLRIIFLVTCLTVWLISAALGRR
jgi:hypothetical protein